MSPATRYDLVVLLHVSADIVFVFGLLASTLVVAALSLQPAPLPARELRLASAMRRWDRAVTGPALGLAWVCGVFLALQAGWFASHWLQAKLVLVVALSALHGVQAAALNRAGAGRPPAPAWRAAPPLALGAIAAVAWLALLKPF